jgi:hypothetical protein
MDSSPFARLPTGVRETIWHYAIVPPLPVQVDLLFEEREPDCWEPLTSMRIAQPGEPGNVLALVRTCKQIYLEANSIYYGSNTFAVLRTGVYQHEFKVPVNRFLSTIGASNAAAVREVVIPDTFLEGLCGDYEEEECAFKELAKFDSWRLFNECLLLQNFAIAHPGCNFVWRTMLCTTTTATRTWTLMPSSATSILATWSNLWL